jgi:hypothetical protein
MTNDHLPRAGVVLRIRSYLHGQVCGCVISIAGSISPCPVKRDADHFVRGECFLKTPAE